MDNTIRLVLIVLLLIASAVAGYYEYLSIKQDKYTYGLATLTMLLPLSAACVAADMWRLRKKKHRRRNEESRSE